jgi:hypothetical protein
MYGVNRDATAMATTNDASSVRATMHAQHATSSPSAIDRAIAHARTKAAAAEHALSVKMSRSMRDLTNRVRQGEAFGASRGKSADAAATHATMHSTRDRATTSGTEGRKEFDSRRYAHTDALSRDWMDDVVARAKVDAERVERLGGGAARARASSTVAAVLRSASTQGGGGGDEYGGVRRVGASPGASSTSSDFDMEDAASPNSPFAAASPRFRASDVDAIKATLKTDYENALKLMRERAEAAEKEVETLTARCGELENGRKSARNALAEMASQNAKLVSAFAAKKDEVRALKASMTSSSALDEEVKAQGIEAKKALDVVKLELRAAREAAMARDEEFAKAQAELTKLRAHVQDKASASKESETNATMELRAKLEAVNKELERERDAFAAQKMHWKSERTKLMKIAAESATKTKADSPTTKKASPAKATASSSPRRLKTPPKKATASPRVSAKSSHRRCELREEAEKLKVLGNQQFHAKAFDAALQSYTDALAVDFTDEAFRAVLHANKAAALQAMGKFCDAVLECCISRTFDDTYIRALQRRADAYLSMGDWPMAMNDLEELAPYMGEDCAAKLREARRKVKNGSTSCEHYAVLGVSSRAQRSEIIKAYKNLALKFHPDKAPSDAVRPASEALFKRVAEAYAVLKDDAQRASYDSAIAAARLRRTYSM